MIRIDLLFEEKLWDYWVLIGISFLCIKDLFERCGIVEDICFVDVNEIYFEVGVLFIEVILELNLLDV